MEVIHFQSRAANDDSSHTSDASYCGKPQFVVHLFYGLIPDRRKRPTTPACRMSLLIFGPGLRRRENGAWWINIPELAWWGAISRRCNPYLASLALVGCCLGVRQRHPANRSRSCTNVPKERVTSRADLSAAVDGDGKGSMRALIAELVHGIQGFRFCQERR